MMNLKLATLFLSSSLLAACVKPYEDPCIPTPPCNILDKDCICNVDSGENRSSSSLNTPDLTVPDGGNGSGSDDVGYGDDNSGDDNGSVSDNTSDSNGDNSDGNNGHGNDDDHDDDSNPGKGKGITR